MILNENEVKTALIYMCEKIFADKIKFIETDLAIRDKVYITAKVIYDYQPFDMSVSFLVNYKNGLLCIYDIDAKVEYLMFKLNFMNLIKHVLKDYSITYTNDTMTYPIYLPIDKVKIGEKTVNIKIK